MRTDNNNPRDSTLYVLDVFSGHLSARVVTKIMAIMAILTAAALITIFLARYPGK